MNDLPWIKYFPREMFLDTIGMSATGERAHRRLCDWIWISDGPPMADNELLKQISQTSAQDWGRTKPELLGKGWKEREGYFLHSRAIASLNEAKSAYVSDQNQTVAANNARKGVVKRPLLELTAPDPQTGVRNIVTLPVANDVTDVVTSPQSQPQSQVQSTPPPFPSKPVEKGSGEKPPSYDPDPGGPCWEIPTEDQAVAMTMTAGIDPEFVRYGYRIWESQNCRNANGILVDFVKHITNRWKNEQIEWRNGTHRGNRKAGANKKPLERLDPGLELKPL